MSWNCPCGAQKSVDYVIWQHPFPVVSPKHIRHVMCVKCGIIYPCVTFDAEILTGKIQRQQGVHIIVESLGLNVTDPAAADPREFTLDMIHWLGRRDSVQDVVTMLLKKYQISKKPAEKLEEMKE